jgi:CBS-domain-containing membrane protein
MNITSLFVAAGGGLAIQLLNLLELKNVPKDKRPDLTDRLYWFSFIGMPILSGFVCYVYLASEFEVKPVLALHIGASAPLILRAAASASPLGNKPVKLSIGQ